MMLNLFSIFDPSSSMYLSMNWMMPSLILLIIPLNYWKIPSRMNMMWVKLFMQMYIEFKLLMNLKYIANLIIFMSLMFTIMLMNMLSLMPYIFTLTSHLSMNLSLSLTLWMSFMMYGWLNNTNNMFIHMVPMNTPFLLMNFMVIIETISNIIRPWTLAIRLAANMLAGHLLLSLLSSSMNNLMTLVLLMMVLIQNMLFILEISVSIIQSYVFSILSVLYFSEI